MQLEPKALEVDVAVGQPLRDGLEAADRAAELFARAGVFGCQLQGPLEDAELEGGQPERPPGGQPAQQVIVADEPVRADGDAGQSQFTGLLSPVVSKAVTATRGRRRPPGKFCAGIGVGRNQEGVGDRPEQDLRPASGQQVAAIGGCRSHRALPGFAVEGDRQHLLPAIAGTPQSCRSP